MPNWTVNYIHMKGISNTKEFFTNGQFDFNKFIPMPDELKDTISGGRIMECVAYYLLKNNTKQSFIDALQNNRVHLYGINLKDTKKKIAEDLLGYIGDNPCMYEIEMYGKNSVSHTPEEIGRHYLDLKEKYGYFNWYDWACANWGTKWNACDTFISGNNDIQFNTAWGEPTPIFYAMSKMYPNKEINIESFYEDGGHNETTFLKGELISEQWYEDEYEDEYMEECV